MAVDWHGKRRKNAMRCRLIHTLMDGFLLWKCGVIIQSQGGRVGSILGLDLGLGLGLGL